MLVFKKSIINNHTKQNLNAEVSPEFIEQNTISNISEKNINVIKPKVARPCLLKAL